MGQLKLDGLVQRIRPTKFDAWLHYNGKPSNTKTEYHQLRIGNQSSNSPNKIGDLIDKSTKLIKPPLDISQTIIIMAKYSS